MKKKLWALIVGIILLTGGVAYSLTWNGSLLTLLNSAISTGDGSVKNLQRPYHRHTWQIIVTGSPSSSSVTLQGSLDNVVWTVLDTSTTTSTRKKTRCQYAKYLCQS